MNAAIDLHQVGRFAEAQSLYEKIILQNPRHADAHHLLGVLASQMGEHQRAVDLIGKAIALAPMHAAFHCNLGLPLVRMKQMELALECFDRAIAIKPDYIDAHFNRGNALRDLKRYEDALASYDRVIAIKPDHGDVYVNRGNTLKALNRLDEALASFDRAMVLKPLDVIAQVNRGNTLKDMGRFDEALACYDRVIGMKPDFAEAHYNRGNVLKDMTRLEQALVSYDRAIGLKADYANAFYNRGNALKDLKRLDEAVASYDRAIAINPESSESYFNRGNTLKALNRLDEALASYQRAIADRPEASLNIALIHLVRGNFKPGWELYESRWGIENHTSPRPIFSQPMWLGQESLKGKTILLHCEQGLGDTIQFCRYAALVAQRGARVVMEVHKPLLVLFEGLDGVDTFVVRGSPLPPFDVHCPLLSLPLAFGTTLETIPTHDHYLTSDPIKREAWAKKLGPKTQPRVGLVWSGNPKHQNDENRSILLAALITYLPAGIHYFSLQKDLRPADQATLEEHPQIRNLGQDLSDFTDTAALVDHMDLVISVDTSVAHLSGALGKRTFVLLPFIPDWRWLMDRDDSPWYPSLRLFRQTTRDDWPEVFGRLQRELEKLIPPQ